MSDILVGKGDVQVSLLAKYGNRHGLIAGATGTGKSVCLNAMILSILMTRRPDEVKLILFDPKMVELSIYNNLPHTLCPAVTDPKKVSAALNWVVVPVVAVTLYLALCPAEERTR